MIYSVVCDAYEVSLYNGLSKLADNVLDVDPANYLEVVGDKGRRTLIENNEQFIKLMRGKTRAYIYPAEDGNDWVYKITKHN